MQAELLNILKKTPEYKQFKRKSQMRSLVALIIIVVFWAIIMFATDFDNIDDVFMLYFGILSMATLFLLRYACRAFFKHPSIIMQGTITDIREKRRTVNEEDRLQSRVSYQYLVQSDLNDCWGECIYDFIEGRGKKHEIGEAVLFFSMSPGNNYIITRK